MSNKTAERKVWIHSKCALCKQTPTPNWLGTTNMIKYPECLHFNAYNAYCLHHNGDHFHTGHRVCILLINNIENGVIRKEEERYLTAHPCTHPRSNALWYEQDSYYWHLIQSSDSITDTQADHISNKPSEPKDEWQPLINKASRHLCLLKLAEGGIYNTLQAWRSIGKFSVLFHVPIHHVRPLRHKKENEMPVK